MKKRNENFLVLFCQNSIRIGENIFFHLQIIHNGAHFFFMEKPIQFHELMAEILSDLPRGFRSLASGDSRITTMILRDEHWIVVALWIFVRLHKSINFYAISATFFFISNLQLTRKNQRIFFIGLSSHENERKNFAPFFNTDKIINKKAEMSRLTLI